MSAQATDLGERLLGLVLLGSEELLTCDLDLTYDEALFLARKYLVEQARDMEREQVRFREQSAMHRLEREEREERDRRRRENDSKLEEWRRTITEALDGVTVDGHGYSYWYGGTVPMGLLKAAEESPEAARALFVEMVEQRKAEDAAREERERERSQRLSNLFREAVDVMIEEKAKEIGMEWTVGLLTSTFALPSGQRVTWGKATRAQHLERMEMLAHNAAANAEAAARHKVAIDTLDETGASCLEEASS